MALISAEIESRKIEEQICKKIEKYMYKNIVKVVHISNSALYIHVNTLKKIFNHIVMLKEKKNMFKKLINGLKVGAGLVGKYSESSLSGDEPTNIVYIFQKWSL